MNMRKKKAATLKTPTLCWSCERAAGTNMCSWAKTFTPVAGWEATSTLLYYTDGSKTEHVCQSFCVHECPLFIPDTP